MTLKEYIKSAIVPGKQPDLSMIYEDLTNMGYKAREIYIAINEQIKENIETIIENYLKNKNENK